MTPIPPSIRWCMNMLIVYEWIYLLSNDEKQKVFEDKPNVPAFDRKMVSWMIRRQNTKSSTLSQWRKMHYKHNNPEREKLHVHTRWPSLHDDNEDNTYHVSEFCMVVGKMYVCRWLTIQKKATQHIRIGLSLHFPLHHSGKVGQPYETEKYKQPVQRKQHHSSSDQQHFCAFNLQ